MSHVHVKISHVLHNKKRKKQTLTKEFRIPLFCPPKFPESKTERERESKWYTEILWSFVRLSTNRILPEVMDCIKTLYVVGNPYFRIWDIYTCCKVWFSYLRSISLQVELNSSTSPSIQPKHRNQHITQSFYLASYFLIFP